MPRGALPSAGSPPRGRGTPFLCLWLGLFGRFIPAWAGNTCAEHSGAWYVTGSSPRGRGTPVRPCPFGVDRRFIPASAGNTTPPDRHPRRASVHPRVGGEHRDGPRAAPSSAGSSPRGRGTRLRQLRRYNTQRFIPAWAGNTSYIFRSIAQGTVHPRVGGEHSSRKPMIQRKLLIVKERTGRSHPRYGTVVALQDSGIAPRFRTSLSAGTGRNCTSLRPSRSVGTRRLRPHVSKS